MKSTTKGGPKVIPISANQSKLLSMLGKREQPNKQPDRVTRSYTQQQRKLDEELGFKSQSYEEDERIDLIKSDHDKNMKTE